MSTDKLISKETLQDKQTRQEQTNHVSSLQFPTREYLHNFHKADLQKRCRELGITKVWVNKEQLIDMILDITQPPSQTLHSAQHSTPPRTPPDSQPAESDAIPIFPTIDDSLTLPTHDEQQISSDDVLLPNSEGRQSSNTSPDVTKTSTIHDVQAPIADDTQQPSADETQQFSAHDTQPPPHCHHLDTSNRDRI